MVDFSAHVELSDDAAHSLVSAAATMASKQTKGKFITCRIGARKGARYDARSFVILLLNPTCSPAPIDSPPDRAPQPRSGATRPANRRAAPRFRCKGLDELIRSKRFTLREQRLFQYLIRQINELGRRFECCAIAIIRVDQRRVAEDAERINERAEQRTLLSELA